MISGRAVLWCLLLGVLVMLLVRMPGVRLYDYLSTRWRGGQTDEPAVEAHAADASAASANPAPGGQVRQPG